MEEEHFGMVVAEMIKAACIVFVPKGGGQVEIVGEDERMIYDDMIEASEKITLEAATVKIEKPLAPVGIKGSVGNADISKAIEEQLKIALDKKHINLKKALKSTGVHEVDAKLGHGIHAMLKVEVVGV